MHEKFQTLNQELDSFKEREETLKKTNNQLQQQIEDSKKAHLDAYGSSN